MSNTLILGRRAIYRRRVLVNPDRVFIAGEPHPARKAPRTSPRTVKTRSKKTATEKDKP